MRSIRVGVATVLMVLVATGSASGHRLRVEPVQAVTQQQIAATLALGDPWPGTHIDSAWLGKCWRRGNHYVACRMFAQYSRTDELGFLRVQVCQGTVAAQADAEAYTVEWAVPEFLTCRETPPPV